MNRADLFASTGPDCWFQVTWLAGFRSCSGDFQTDGAKWQGTEKAAFLRYNEFHTSSVSTWARSEVKDVEEMILILLERCRQKSLLPTVQWTQCMKRLKYLEFKAETFEWKSFLALLQVCNPVKQNIPC